MSKKKKVQKRDPVRKPSSPSKQAQKHKDSVFTEAWENMSEDMGKFLPEFLVRRLQDRKGRAWAMIAMTFVELVVLGVVGKFVYDWFVNP